MCLNRLLYINPLTNKFKKRRNNFVRIQNIHFRTRKILSIEIFITCGAISGTLLLTLLALDMIGLIPGVPGVHGAVEDRGPGERE